MPDTVLVVPLPAPSAPEQRESTALHVAVYAGVGGVLGVSVLTITAVCVYLMVSKSADILCNADGIGLELRHT